MTKLSAAQKQQIRQQWETKTSRELQDEFGCSKSTIRRVMQEGGETSSGINLTVTDESKEEDDNFVYSAVDEEQVQELPLVSSFEGDDGLPTDAAAAAVEQEAFDSLLPPAGATQEDIAKASEVAAAAAAAAAAETAEVDGGGGGEEESKGASPQQMDSILASLNLDPAAAGGGGGGAGLDALLADVVGAPPPAPTKAGRRKAAPAPSAPPPPAAAAAEAAEGVPDAFLRMAIRRYSDAFPDSMDLVAGEREVDKNTLLKSLVKAPRSQLEDVYAALKCAQAHKTCHTLLTEGCNTVLSIVETVGTQTGALEIHGLSEALAKEKEFQNVMLECSIDDAHNLIKYSRPRVRAATMVASAMFRLHYSNRAQRLMREAGQPMPMRQQQPAAPDDEEGEEAPPPPAQPPSGEGPAAQYWDVGEAQVQAYDGL